VFRLTGTDDVGPVRALAMLADAITAVLLAAEARRRFGGRHTELLAGGLFVLAVVVMSPAAGFEVFVLPFMTAAMVLGARRRHTAAGASLAAATLAKQTAATTLVPLLWLAWHARRWRGVVVLGAAFVVPVVIAALVFGWHDFWFWVLTGNGGYLDPSGAVGHALARDTWQTAIFVGAHVVPIVGAAFAWRFRRQDADLWLWLVAGAIAVAAGFHFFSHYYLQLLPPLVLLAARGFVATPALRSRGVLLVLAAVAVATLGWFVGPRFFPGDNHTARVTNRLARYVAAHTEPGQRILVWGNTPEVYWRSDRRPATRFVTTHLLTGYGAGRPTDQVGEDRAVDGAWDEFLADLDEHPPVMIIDVTTAGVRGGVHYHPDRFPDFRAYLRDGTWKKVATVAGAVVYVPA